MAVVVRHQNGDNSKQVDWTNTLVAELRAIAASQLARERKGHILQPTALVNEAFIKLRSNGASPWQSRAHFLGAAANAMHQVLADYAKARMAKKRSGRWKRLSISFVENRPGRNSTTMDGDLFCEGVDHLKGIRVRWAQAVIDHFLGGMTAADMAEARGLSTRQWQRILREAMIELYRWLEDQGDAHEPN
jgi:RNA polymerase sigma-70 factor (ECF subfamily)